MTKIMKQESLFWFYTCHSAINILSVLFRALSFLMFIDVKTIYYTSINRFHGAEVSLRGHQRHRWNLTSEYLYYV